MHGRREGSASAGEMALGQMKQEIFDNSRIAVIQRDFENHVLYANAAALTMAGVACVEELRLDVLFAGEAARILDDETRGRRNRQLGAYGVSLTRQDGREVAVEVTGIPLMDAQGTAIGSLGLFRSLDDQVLTSRLRQLTLTLAGSPELLPSMAEALRTELPFDLMLVSQVVADNQSWESEVFFHHPPFDQPVPRAWYELDCPQRAFMEATRGSIQRVDTVMSEPPWSDMADEPLCRLIRDMGLKSSMWRRIVRGDGDVERTVAILTLLSRDPDAYDEESQALFNRLPLVETVLSALDHDVRRRDRRELRMFRELNRCVDVQSACSCLSLALVEIFDWAHVSIFRVNSARETIVRVASARRGDDGLAEDAGTVWGDHTQRICEGVLGRVVATGEPQKVPDVSLDGDYIDVSEARPVRSELAVPIMFTQGQRVRFIVDVDDPRFNAFSREHVRQLTDIANEVAGSIQRISDLKLLDECVDNVSDPIIATDAKLRIRRLNKAAEALFGAERAELEGRSLIPLFSNPQPLEALLAGTESRDRLGELKVCRQKDGDVESDGPVSVFVTRRDFPEQLGGHLFIARDLRPIRRSVQLEFLEQTAYELAVETQSPLGMAMSYLESQLESACRSPQPEDERRTRDLQAVLRQLGRVKHAFTRLALYNREARESARVMRTVQVNNELHALLSSLTTSERAKVDFEDHGQRVDIEADPLHLHIVVESLLSSLLRAAAESGRVAMTLVRDVDVVFLRLRGKLPPARRLGARLGASEAAQADLRLANPLLVKLMKNLGGGLRVQPLGDGDTEFVLTFPQRRSHV